MAAENGDIDMARYLLAHNYVDVNSYDEVQLFLKFLEFHTTFFE